VGADPNPNNPDQVRHAMAGSDMILSARLGGDVVGALDDLDRLAGSDMRLIGTHGLPIGSFPKPVRCRQQETLEALFVTPVAINTKGFSEGHALGLRNPAGGQHQGDRPHDSPRDRHLGFVTPLVANTKEHQGGRHSGFPADRASSDFKP